MSWWQIITFLLTHFATSPLAAKILNCVLTNSTPQAIWACVLGNLQAANLAPGSPDHAAVEYAKTQAAGAGL